MTHYKIDIVSDTVCPWCYVGKRRLDLAILTHLKTHPSDSFSTTWHAFQLNPDAPLHSSIDKQSYYAAKFGLQRTQLMQAHLARLGSPVGIEFAFAGKTGNTRDSHRLVQLARRKGEAVQNRVVEALFKTYFEQNEDITKTEVLVKAAGKAGIGEDEAREWLREGKGGEEVEEEIRSAQEKSISGVPNFTINGKYEVRGAEEVATFVQVFGEIKGAEEGGAVVGERGEGAEVCVE